MHFYIFETLLICGALLVLAECQWLNPDPQTIGRLVMPPGWDESTVSLYEPPLRESEPTLPELFDARFHWHNCTDVISRIGSQGHCGSCWAFAVAHAISDRICIASRGAAKPWISAQDLMECTGIKEEEEVEDGTTPHGSEFIGQACTGNWPAAAWAHYVHHGIVSGGNTVALNGCKPYLFSCAQRFDASYCPNATDMRLSCVRNCENENYKVKYLEDRHFGKDYNYLNLSENVADLAKIQRVIYEQGPITACIDADVFKEPAIDGVFVKKANVVNHAIRIIGWGVSEKMGNYWIIANSWGQRWNGDGTAKVAFGAAAMQKGRVYFGQPKAQYKKCD